MTRSEAVKLVCGPDESIQRIAAVERFLTDLVNLDVIQFDKPLTVRQRAERALSDVYGMTESRIDEVLNALYNEGLIVDDEMREES